VTSSLKGKPKMRIPITEYLDIDIDKESWVCNRCDAEIGPAGENYKKGCLVATRMPEEVYERRIDGP
jgi:acetophenone carboxylase